MRRTCTIDWNGTSLRLLRPYCHITPLTSYQECLEVELATDMTSDAQSAWVTDKTSIWPHNTCLLPQRHGLRRANWKHMALSPDVPIMSLSHSPLPDHCPTQLNSPSLSHPFSWVKTNCSQPNVHPHRSRVVDNGACCWLAHFRLICSQYRRGNMCYDIVAVALHDRYLISANRYDP